MSNVGTPGGWSEFSCDITPQAQSAFDEAMDGWVGVTYSPVAFAEQVVEGMNYSFFCNSESATLPSFSSAAIVDIHESLSGEAKITRITSVER